jgi:ParB-like chromosome segregation protein Spo0J
MSDTGRLPAGLALVAVDRVQPCPIQPRVNFSVVLIEQLSSSMRAGRHQPLLEVEPAPGAPGRYQIVCGEQRWRAARAAGLTEVLVRLNPPLGYLERLEKQYEENRLRADLDPVEEAHCLLLDHTIRSIAVAERLLRDALVPFQPLADRRVTEREEFMSHLEQLKALLVRKRVHVVRSADVGLQVGPLAPWRETEQALGVSESSRKAKVGILRLDPDVQEQVRALPAEHAIQISRLGDRERQAELANRARELTHDQVRGAVERLRRDPDLAVEAAVESQPPAGGDEDGPLAFQQQLGTLADLCRQFLRLLDNLRPRLSADERREVGAVLVDLRRAIAAFAEEEAAA